MMTQRWNRCIPQKLEDTHWLHRFGKLAEYIYLPKRRNLRSGKSTQLLSLEMYIVPYSLALLPTRPVGEIFHPVIFGRWSWRGGRWSGGNSLEDYMPPLDVSSEGRGPMKISHEVSSAIWEGVPQPPGLGDLRVNHDYPPCEKNIHQEVRMKERVYLY